MISKANVNITAKVLVTKLAVTICYIKFEQNGKIITVNIFSIPQKGKYG